MDVHDHAKQWNYDVWVIDDGVSDQGNRLDWSISAIIIIIIIITDLYNAFRSEDTEKLERLAAVSGTGNQAAYLHASD